MKWQAIVIIIIALVVIGGGSFYITQQQKPLPTSSPTSTATPTSTPTPTPTPTLTPTSSPTPTPTPTPTQSAEEEGRIRDMVKAYYANFSQHSEGNVAGFFTENGQKLLNNGKDGSFIGRNAIKTSLAKGFAYCIDLTIKELNITKVQIEADKATVQCKYEQSSTICATLDITENMQLTKVGDTWKIAKTDLEFIPAKD
jgi:hypothetical protein